MRYFDTFNRTERRTPVEVNWANHKSDRGVINFKTYFPLAGIVNAQLQVYLTELTEKQL